MIIHDECHSVSNKTTQEFYEHITFKEKDISCIGFSATPPIGVKPYETILSTYSIYDAFCDDIIVPPYIKWISCDEILDYEDILHFCKKSFKNYTIKKL